MQPLRFIFPEYPNENDDENRDLGLIFNFDFVETAMLVTCINKFPHTRLLAVFNWLFLARPKIKIVYSVFYHEFFVFMAICGTIHGIRVKINQS